MPRVRFTPNVQRHVPCPAADVPGATVHEVLEAYFTVQPRARGYVLDDQGALRPHMAIFVNSAPILDRVRMSDAVPADAEVFVMQALSGG